MEGTTGRQRLGKSTLSDCLIPFPSITEQTEIAQTLSTTDKKINFHKRKKQTLESLFNSALHQLMTGVVRVENSDLLTTSRKISQTEKV